MVEILEFDLTTLGFNVQNTLVPSRTLNRVPTVFSNGYAIEKEKDKAHVETIRHISFLSGMILLS